MVRTILKCAAAGGLAAALVGAASAGATGRYVDAAGDSGGAPDITRVTVDSDSAGQILFTVIVTDPRTSPEARLFVCLDTDQNARTGDPWLAGADYRLVVGDEGNALEHWTGGEWHVDPGLTVSVLKDTELGTVGVSVNRRELGGAGGFNFWLRSGASPLHADPADAAPDAGAWNYSLRYKAPEIRDVVVQAFPLVPRAGRPYRVRPVGLRLPEAGDPGAILPAPERYACRARLAGKRLAGHGAGGCVWLLPATARGRSLAVVVTVAYQGASRDVAYTARVAK
jgi:hypothetical protein